MRMYLLSVTELQKLSLESYLKRVQKLILNNVM